MRLIAPKLSFVDPLVDPNLHTNAFFLALSVVLSFVKIALLLLVPSTELIEHTQLSVSLHVEFLLSDQSALLSTRQIKNSLLQSLQLFL